MSISGQASRKRSLKEIDEQTTVLCTVVAVDRKNMWYRVCSLCEKPLPENVNVSCSYCNRFNPGTSGSKRLYRILMSIATDSEVVVVIMFDRAAYDLFGCSADDFFDFAKTHPYAAMAAGEALMAEMLTVTLSKPKNANAEHIRVTSVVRMSTHFQPVIRTLEQMYSAHHAGYSPSLACPSVFKNPFREEGEEAGTSANMPLLID